MVASTFVAFATKIIVILILLCLLKTLYNDTKETFKEIKEGKKPVGDVFEPDDYLFLHGATWGVLLLYCVCSCLDIVGGFIFGEISKSSLIIDWIFLTLVIVLFAYYCITEKKLSITIDIGNKTKEEPKPEEIKDKIEPAPKD